MANCGSQQQSIVPDPELGSNVSLGDTNSEQSSGESCGVGRDLIQVALAAGPITFLSMHFGHWIAYGTSATTPQFIYFACYTLVAGIATLALGKASNRGRSKIKPQRLEQDFKSSKQWVSAQGTVNKLSLEDQDFVAEVIQLVIEKKQDPVISAYRKVSRSIAKK